MTFILPMLNEIEHIARVLDSISNQTYSASDIEIIVIDCGSTDGSLELVEARPVRLLQLAGQSISALRNKGASIARGDFLVFMDSDCVIDPNWLATGLTYFDDDTVGIVGQFGDADPDASNWFQRAIAFRDHQVAEIEERTWLPARSFIVRRELFERVGGFNEDLRTAEDVDFCYRVHKTHRVLRVKKMRTWHLGEDRDPLTHFRKEIWRGKYSLRRAFSSGLELAEIPSLLLPCYFLLVESGLVAFLVHAVFSANWAPFFLFLFLFLYLAPPFLFSLRAACRAGSWRFLFSLALALLAYMTAKSLALVIEMSELLRPGVRPAL